MEGLETHENYAKFSSFEDHVHLLTMNPKNYQVQHQW